MRYDILTGLMLGDGYIGYPHKGSKKPRIEIERTATEKGYHDWVKEHLGVEWKADQVRNKANGYHGIKIKSSCDERLIEIHKTWYKYGVRSIPKEWLKEHFNEVSLAVWYLDDGSLTERTRDWSPNSVSREITICSENFTIEEMEWIVDFLEEKYGLRFHVSGKGRLKLYKKDHINKFMELIEPTVKQIPCMTRKLQS